MAEKSDEGLDQSDARLVEALKQGIKEGRFEVGTGSDAEEQPEEQPHAVFGGSVVGGGTQVAPADGGDDFFVRLNAYRAAKATGDRELIAQAERALHDYTRNELRDYECTTGPGPMTTSPFGMEARMPFRE